MSLAFGLLRYQSELVASRKKPYTQVLSVDMARGPKDAMVERLARHVELTLLSLSLGACETSFSLD